MDYNSQLTHSGILGMKWGVRRYQNKDGSLTTEGRQHYGVGESRNTSTTKTSNTVSNTPNTTPKAPTVKEMSAAELRDAKERMRLENEYYTELEKMLTRNVKEEKARVEAAKPFIQKYAEKAWKDVAEPAITNAVKQTLENYLKVQGNKIVRELTKTEPAETDKNKQNQNKK